MEIGQLDKRGTLEDASHSDDGYGGGGKTWSKVNDLWCSITPLRGSEFYEGQKITSSVDTRIVIRAPVEDTSGSKVRPKPNMRFIHDGRTFGIEYVIDLHEEGDWYELYCKEDIS